VRPLDLEGMKRDLVSAIEELDELSSNIDRIRARLMYDLERIENELDQSK